MRRLAVILVVILCARGLTTAIAGDDVKPLPAKSTAMKEVQVTDQPGGHILTNVNVWSPDGQWIVYDRRSDPAGEKFDGDTIEIVNVETGEVREVYRSRDGAHCGVATFSPTENKVVFILGPENPTADWQYGMWHRQGVIVDTGQPGRAVRMDARDITPPFTPGALRGGSHVHVFDGDGKWVSFTYEDHVLAELDAAKTGRTLAEPVAHTKAGHESNLRNVGISVPAGAVKVSTDHPRNHDGSMFTVLATRTVDKPRPGSDEISKAFEDAWVGKNGYVRADGTRQRHALAFQGHVVTPDGKTIAEAFVVDIPDDVTVADDAPLQGTATTRPRPPRGTEQRRLTHTADRKYPGIQGPRHWLRSSADGSRIALLMRDEAGRAQLWTVSPNGGEPKQVTHHPFDIASTFTWSLNGKSVAYVADNSVFVTDVASGESKRLTERSEDAHAPRPEACVFSPDGTRIAYVRPVEQDGVTSNQIFVVRCE
jgi:hypothetical protein